MLPLLIIIFICLFNFINAGYTFPSSLCIGECFGEANVLFGWSGPGVITGGCDSLSTLKTCVDKCEQTEFNKFVSSYLQRFEEYHCKDYPIKDRFKELLQHSYICERLINHDPKFAYIGKNCPTDGPYVKGPICLHFEKCDTDKWFNGMVIHCSEDVAIYIRFNYKIFNVIISPDFHNDGTLPKGCPAILRFGLRTTFDS